MAVYQYSWLILFAPLLSFVIIIFGTRMWDLASRRGATDTGDAGHAHGDAHGAVHGDEHGEHGHSDDDDPKVPALSPGAKLSAYVGTFVMLVACVFSWYLLLNSVFNPGVLSYGGTYLNLSWK